jgi:hypothetical protein
VRFLDEGRRVQVLQLEANDVGLHRRRIDGDPLKLRKPLSEALRTLMSFVQARAMMLQRVERACRDDPSLAEAAADLLLEPPRSGGEVLGSGKTRSDRGAERLGKADADRIERRSRGHGGVLGAAGHDGAPLLHYLPTARHTWRSDVNVTQLPSEVKGVRQEGFQIETVPVAIKGPDGTLLETAIPKVVITKDASYWDDYGAPDPEAEVDLIAMIAYMLKSAPLAGFVVEGFTPYGRPASNARHQLMLRAVQRIKTLFSDPGICLKCRQNSQTFDFLGVSRAVADFSNGDTRREAISVVVALLSCSL